jgi:hypothetical protein
MEKSETPLLPDSTNDSGPTIIDALFKEDSDVIPVLKLMTHLYVLHQNDVYLDQLKTFSHPQEVQHQIDMLIKLIYFEDEGFLPVDIRDLVDAVESH